MPVQSTVRKAELELELEHLPHPRTGLSTYLAVKRVVDVASGGVGLLLFGILYPIIGLAIKLETRGPVVVSLQRVSNGRTIRLYKFRSMTYGAHAKKPLLSPFNERSDGPFFKMHNDPRLTRVGKLIRKFRLDEVPQFINVLRGELSLVGPRPHEPGEVAQYPLGYAFLAHHKAGITGLSQVNGASSLPFKRELSLDSFYIAHQSLWLDIKIIGKTIAIFLFDPSAV